MKRFSKSIFLTILVVAMAVALVGCKSAQVEPLEPVEPAAVEVPAEQPAAPAEQPAAPAETPAETPAEQPAAPAEEPAAPAETALEPVVLRYVIAGKDIVVKADVGSADVTYPADIITDEDLVAALQAAVAQYPFLVDTVKYEYIQPGHIVLTYPEEWGYEDLMFAQKLGMDYVAQVLGTPVEAPAEAPAEVAELPEWTISLYGYEAKIVYENKVATITYPSFITNAEVIDAAGAAYAAYGAYLQGTELAVDNGTAYLTFPVELSEADIDAAVRILAAELPAYVAAVVIPAHPEVAEAEAAPAVERTFSILGYEATIVYADKVATITYPAFITNAEVAQAAKTAYAAYSKYLQGTELTINNGTAILTFPVDITAEDIDFAVAMLGAELPAYVATVLAPQPQEVATVAEAPAEAPAEQSTAAPAAAPAEQPAAEAPAAEAPAAAPASQPAAAPASTPAPAAQTAKKSNTGLIIVIIVLVIAACAAVAIILKKKKK
ncbi:MAG: hypothetical protein IJS84_01735 [Spirochaetales bacterium]|nr:hypothetical protein [Spirochaetales bacterium]